jgi:hypothetical protein
MDQIEQVKEQSSHGLPLCLILHHPNHIPKTKLSTHLILPQSKSCSKSPNATSSLLFLALNYFAYPLNSYKGNDTLAAITIGYSNRQHNTTHAQYWPNHTRDLPSVSLTVTPEIPLPKKYQGTASSILLQRVPKNRASDHTARHRRISKPFSCLVIDLHSPSYFRQHKIFKKEKRGGKGTCRGRRRRPGFTTRSRMLGP